MTYGVGDLVSQFATFAANCGQCSESDPTPANRNPGIWTRIWLASLDEHFGGRLTDLVWRRSRPLVFLVDPPDQDARGDLSEAGAER